ncbi:MAG TPA: glycosyltransferase family 4 protein [Gemmatimonadales bacterium]|nr:glycosyltransferase family 4 protein [Gemmatimonadales bacterium]
MRIALISTPFAAVPPQAYGGTELIVYELAEGLVARGHDVTLYATGDSQTTANLKFIYPVAAWPPDPFVDLNHVSWAYQDAMASGFELIHAHSTTALALGRMAPRIPLVYTIHHDRQERITNYYRQFPQVWYVTISADQSVRQAPLRRSAMIHHGLDAGRFSWTEEPGEYAVFIGRLAEEKGPHTAIDAAALAGVPIRVAGEVHPPDRAFARAEVEPRLALPHVTYLGNIGLATKVPLLRDARAVLVPITWHEPFGLIIIEAMLSGCPVLGFPMGSVPELVEPAVTGYVVRDVQEMADLLRPGSVLDRFDRRRCRAHAMQRFGRARLVAEHEALYARVIADVGERRPRLAPVPAA